MNAYMFSMELTVQNYSHVFMLFCSDSWLSEFLYKFVVYIHYLKTILDDKMNKAASLKY